MPEVYGDPTTGIISCPVCSTTDVTQFLEIYHVPVQCNRLWTSRAEALEAPSGNIRLGFCSSCGHIFNYDFNIQLTVYSEEYENSLHFSPQFQQYATTLAEKLIHKHKLYNKDLIEIGCGKGDFLTMLCEAGRNRGIGFDPSYEKRRSAVERKCRSEFIQDLYSEKYAAYKPDFVCCRHVLEHIEFPRVFLNTIRRAVGNRKNTVLFFEVPNVMYTLKDLGIWDIIYEHCGYFSSPSLARLFLSCGFHVQELTEAFEGQFLHIEASPIDERGDDKTDHLDAYTEEKEKITDLVATFTKRYQGVVKRWSEEMERVRQLGQKAVVWGGGSKGIAFLNTLKVMDGIKFVVDMNPHKQGKFIAGTGQEIVPPEYLKTYQPDSILVMNPVYFDEIQGISRSMHLTAKHLQV